MTYTIDPTNLADLPKVAELLTRLAALERLTVFDSRTGQMVAVSHVTMNGPQTLQANVQEDCEVVAQMTEAPYMLVPSKPRRSRS